MYNKKNDLRKWRGAATGLLILIMPVWLSAQQPVFQQAPFHLPWPMSALGELTAYIPSQQAIYIFGGVAQPLGWMDTIIKVDLSREQVSVLSTHLPFSRDGQLAVAYNSYDGKVYLFHLTDIYRFDPETETISLVAGGILPEIAGDYTIVKYAPTQNVIYLFGNRGSGGGNYTLRYDPANNAVQVLSNTMQPSNNTSPSAAYCDSRDAVYLFGGNFSSYSYDLIQKFDPTAENFFTLPISLPTIAGAATAVSVPEVNAIFVFGGYDNSIALNDVYKFDCGSETLTQMPDLPTPLVSAGIEYAQFERRIYILGGTTARTGGYYPATDLVYYLALNTVPVADAGIDQTIECTSSAGANVTLDGTGSHDADNDHLTYTWRINGEVVAGPTNNPISQLPLALGSHSIELTVDDGRGGTDTDEVTIHVVDTTAPTLSVSLTPNILWPPNHKMQNIQATVIATDLCDPAPSVVLVSILSDEPDDGLGDGDKPNDIQGADFGVADYAFQLRAERSGTGDGRVYTVTYKATDASGNSAIAFGVVNVPHNMGKAVASAGLFSLPQNYALLQNYPNPFNPATEIRFQLPEANHVVVKIFNTLGHEIRTLVEAPYEAGYHNIRWDGKDRNGNAVSSGIYVYQLQASRFRQIMKMNLLR